jgi:hypothetical protein
VADHTPGPWKVTGPARTLRYDEEGDFGIYVDAVGGVVQPIIAEAFRHVGPGMTFPSEANARLIAEAPAMLEALERIAALEEAKGGDWMDGPAQGIARAAIARARGDS